MNLPTFFITYKLQIIWFKEKEISTKLCMIFASEISGFIEFYGTRIENIQAGK